MTNVLLANLIRSLHFILIAFVIVVPILYLLPTGNEGGVGVGVGGILNMKLWPLLILHFTVCISLLVHWKFNDDTCFLTVVESSLRGIPMRNSFMHSIVSPIYKIQNDTVKNISSMGVPLLMLVVASQLFLLRHDISSDISLIKRSIF